MNKNPTPLIFILGISIGCILMYIVKNQDLWSKKEEIVLISSNCAKTIKTTDHVEAWPDEIETIEKTWDETIPDHLIQIGGIDWKGWASICRNEQDPEGIFRGEYRDAKILYKGQFKYIHPENRPLPEDVFDYYYMSHYKNGKGILFREIKKPGKEFFYMSPINFHKVQLANEENY